MRCRTGQLGGVQWHCTGCGRSHWVGRSCGNRHCPTCGHQRTHQWLAKQSQKLLPGVHHFLVTFTVPKELRCVLAPPASRLRSFVSSFGPGAPRRGGQDEVAEGLAVGLLRSPAHLGTRSDGLSSARALRPTRRRSGARPARPTARLATDTDQLSRSSPHADRSLQGQARRCAFAAGLYDLVPLDAWKKDFVVDIQPVDDGHSAVAYLAPYVHRVAMGDQRIVDVTEHSVTYRFKPKKSKTMPTRTVSGQSFVRGFAQHILPTGFRKVRYFGWMASNSRTKLEELRMIVWFSLGWVYWLATAHTPPPPPTAFPKVRCAACGATMKILGITNQPVAPTLSEHPQSYLDSGWAPYRR